MNINDWNSSRCSKGGTHSAVAVMSRQYAQDGEEPQVRHLREDSGMLHYKRDGRRVVHWSCWVLPLLVKEGNHELTEQASSGWGFSHWALAAGGKVAVWWSDPFSSQFRTHLFAEAKDGETLVDDLSLHCKAIGITWSYHGVSVFSREYFSPFFALLLAS